MLIYIYEEVKKALENLDISTQQLASPLTDGEPSRPMTGRE
jgi:hypothetical protein